MDNAKLVNNYMKMEATYSSETSVDFQWTTQRYFPEDRTLVSSGVACSLYTIRPSASKFIVFRKKRRHAHQMRVERP
jgi:hypothetical protein